MAEVPSRSRHAHRRPRPTARLITVGVAALALLVVGVLGGYLLGRGAGSSSPAPASPSAQSAPSVQSAPSAVPAASTSGLPSRPTMVGDVTRVVSGDEVVVRVGGSDTTVRVLGLATPDPMSSTGGPTTAECGSREALQFADAQLSGQAVTIVPDPTIPELDDQGRRLGYVVLRSQLNYTDAALLGGIGWADTSRPLWYADVFAREQSTAASGERGVWGAPCHRRP